MSENTCGYVLLRAPVETFDFLLRFSTPTSSTVVSVYCHRAILVAYSEYFRHWILHPDHGGEFHHQLNIRVDDGQLGAALELIQFMYLRDPTLLSNRNKVLQLCGLFRLYKEHLFIRSLDDKPHESRIPNIILTLVFDDSVAISSQDFVKAVSVEKAKLILNK